jgi:hypothetical protein
MGDLKKQERAAIKEVAGRFSARWEEGGDPSDAYITIAGKRVALEVAVMKEPGGNHGGRAKPRLRFDKVAVRLVERLQATLREVVPDDVTVLLTITAPIRLPSKSAVALEGKIRVLLAQRPAPREERGTIHGNDIRIRLENTGSKRAPRVIGFVHNSDTDPRVLMDMTRSLLELFCARAHRDPPKKFAGDRWLVAMNEGGASRIEAYRYIYSQLRIPTKFKKILIVFGDGPVETLK